jgi:hypothetical protein
MAPSFDDQWSCTLSASPKQVRKNDRVALTVRLDQSRFGGLDDDQKRAVYTTGFTFDPTCSSTTLQTAINKAWQARTITAEGIQFSLTVPNDIADGDHDIRVEAKFHDSKLLTDLVLPAHGHPFGEHVTITITRPITTEAKVTLQRTSAGFTNDLALWSAIRNRTAAIGFDRYTAFINCVFCDDPQNDPFRDARTKISKYLSTLCLDDLADQHKRLSIHGPYAYSVLKLATQVFLTLESGVVIRDSGRLPTIFDTDKERIRLNDSSLTIEKVQGELLDYLPPPDRNLPYLNRILANLITVDPRDPKEVLPYCLGVLQFRLTSPSLIELIWSYWLEEGMLVQTMNAIARRFQNRRGSPNDPLGELEFDPLRPLNNLIWGFIADEHSRLTVPRRAHEYIHHYGLPLVGKAVPDLNPADARSKFIEAFHNLLSAAARFFRDDSDTTVLADAFPLLNALKDVHLILAEGAHNQFGDLTWTARAEMMTIQWMLARPEMREFLRGRYMVPYQEEWMGAVDSMKKLQGWTDTTITHFYELAVTGERILLSVRYGDWSDIENIEDQAKNWARSCKPEIQRYIYAYKTVTGVDLAADVVDSRDAATRYLQPSVLLHRRLAEQMSAMRLGGQSAPDLVAARVSARAQLTGPVRPKLPTSRKDS